MENNHQYDNVLHEKFIVQLQKTGLTQNTIRFFHKMIYTYYKTHGRTFPWRKTHDPYCILVSEIMLQQTQTSRVVDKYKQFINHYPNIRALAHARLRDVLKVWQGLGYNRRALVLRKTANIIVSKFNSRIPRDRDTLMKLPGVGDATAGAICAFAFHMPVVFIETNIRTVYLYFFFEDHGNVKDADILPLIGKTIDRTHPRQWYQALMDYGVLIKQVYKNPGRKSAHYTKQTTFKGSDRQIRGKIIRVLTEKSCMSESEIIQYVSAQPQRVKRILSQLIKEQLLKMKRRTYTIA
jgi:A/G-specific adenine glycosylase